MIDLGLTGVIDQQTLKHCIAGRRDAQELLYNYFAPTMFGICLRYASDYHSAEDILQEGFIKVFNNIDRFRGEGSFEGWMKRIFINTAIEYYRKATHYSYVDIELAADQSTKEVALQNLMKDDLLKVIQQLTPGYRTVFNLYAIEGYSHKEIGKMLNISDGTSKSQLARARMALKRLIKAIS